MPFEISCLHTREHIILKMFLFFSIQQRGYASKRGGGTFGRGKYFIRIHDMAKRVNVKNN
jgi:hypothetical protein